MCGKEDGVKNSEQTVAKNNDNSVKTEDTRPGALTADEINDNAFSSESMPFVDGDNSSTVESAQKSQGLNSNNDCVEDQLSKTLETNSSRIGVDAEIENTNTKNDLTVDISKRSSHGNSTEETIQLVDSKNDNAARLESHGTEGAEMNCDSDRGKESSIDLKISQSDTEHSGTNGDVQHICDKCDEAEEKSTSTFANLNEPRTDGGATINDEKDRATISSDAENDIGNDVIPGPTCINLESSAAERIHTASFHGEEKQFDAENTVETQPKEISADPVTEESTCSDAKISALQLDQNPSTKGEEIESSHDEEDDVIGRNGHEATTDITDSESPCDQVDKELTKLETSLKNSEISSRLQRWAGKAVKAGKDLAREKKMKPDVEIKSEISRFCGLFMQLSSGRCISLDDSISTESEDKHRRIPFRKRNNPKILSTSVLVIRKSIEEPCPSKGYRYQWYRSKLPQSEFDPETLNDQDHWVKISGANMVMFQPTVLEIGFKVKCVVRAEEQDFNGIDTVTLVTPSMIESDKVLFDAALKTFKPTQDNKFVCVSSFDNFMEIGNQTKRKIKIDLHTFRNEEKEGYRSFLMKLYSTEEVLFDEDADITKINVVLVADKAKEFWLEWQSNGKNRRLKIQAPSRISRESFLLAMGIASFDGKHSELNTKAALFKPSTEIKEEQVKRCNEDDLVQTFEEELEEIPGENALDEPIIDKEGREQTTTPPINHNLSAGTNETPNSAWTRVETELYEDILQLQNKLDGKNKDVSDLKDEVLKLHDELKTERKFHSETKKDLLISRKHIETLQSDLRRSKEDQSKHLATYEKQKQRHMEEILDFEKSVKALANEKAVLKAAVEARTAKLSKMEELKVEVKSLKVQVADRDELLNQNKVAAQKTTDFEKLIHELQNCKISQENVILQLKEELQAAQKESDDKKSSISDLTASLNNTRNQIQKCKADRNKWKQKAESLAKEMSKICRNSNESSNDLDNLHAEIDSLRKEVSLLKLQKNKAEDDLEESVLVHTRYVEAHLRSDGDAIRAYQKVDELERVLQNLTEYVDAKETQLLSIQEVNRALTEELQNNKHHDV